MSKPVKGFLAMDGTFFERAPECMRYEATRGLERLCESHGTNFENFLICVNAWNKLIKEYYDADSKCKEPQVREAEVQFNGDDTIADELSDGTDIPAFLRDEEHRADPPVGSKDAPGFLEQQIRKRI